MENPLLTRIEKAYLHGKRPRVAGRNSRLPVHGQDVHEAFARLHFEDGSSGFGFSAVTPEQADMLLGQTLEELISPEYGVTAQARSIEFPLWDALGQRTSKPIYRLLSSDRAATPFSAPCYDTSLYFDDLHLPDEAAGAQLIAEQARWGYEHGHRAFKIKVGRGALHMPLDGGTHRDIAVIRAVRQAVGPGLPIMIDANNGYNVNIVKQVLSETADCGLYWLEEAFHEDRVLYQHLHEWQHQQGLSVLIADGEGQASPSLMDWAHAGIVDVVQYDLRDIGLSKWLKVGRQLDAWASKSAPHNYGSAFGNYATGHLAAVLKHFTFVEWDHIDMDGLDTSGYRVEDGRVHLPDSPGFGLKMDEALFAQSVKAEGFVRSR